MVIPHYQHLPFLKRLVLLFVICSLFTLPVTAQTSVTDDEVNAVAKQLYCPVCENIPLDACGTAACVQWREEIRTQLSSGLTEQQVIDDFVSRFGERVVGTPQDPALRALSLVTPWIFAAIVLLAGIYIVLRWQARRQTEAGSTEALIMADEHFDTAEQDYRLRVERDLKERL